MKSDAVETLESLIRIDSNFNKSNKEMIDFIENKLSKFKCKRYKVDGTDLDLYNLVVRIKGKNSEPSLVFVGHTDTVPPEEKRDNKGLQTGYLNWKVTSNPWSAVEKNGRIYGLGSCDMKGGLTAMICAALSLEKTPPNDIYLIFDADEEKDGRGGLDLKKKFSLANSKVIVAESSDGCISYSQKGCIDLDIKTNGKEKHSSEADYKFNTENNAIYKMLKVQNALLDYEKRLFDTKDDPKYGKPTFNMGQVHGGVAANKTAAECNLRTCRRVINGENIDEVYKELTDIILSADPKAKLRKGFWGETFETKTDTPFINRVISFAEPILGKIGFKTESACTEAWIFAKYGEAIIFGPGMIKRAHKGNEYLEIKTLENFTKIYRTLMINGL